MPGIAGLRKFFGRTISEGAAFAAGVAVAPTLEPEVQFLKNEAWSKVASKPLEASDAAEIVAEDVALQDWGRTEASQTGIDSDRFDLLADAVRNAPGLGELYRLWRRGEINDALFVHGLRKARLEPTWDGALKALKDERLTPQEVALGIVRSIITDPGLLATELDTSDSNVPRYEPLSLDALEEAAAGGFDRERLRGLVGEIGLPMSAQQAASAFFRGIITEGAFNQAILEGDTRPEWAPFILDQSRQIPSAGDYIAAEIRGWITREQRNAGIERHGMTPDDGDLLFSRTGRPATTHQAFIGYTRGGRLADVGDDERATFRKAVIESDIRPEWEPILWAGRFTYPSAFVLRSMAQSGDLTEQETHTILVYEGWEPALAAQVAQRWSAGGTAASKEATASDLLTLLDGEQATTAETLTSLEALGYSPTEAQRKIDLLAARRVASAKGAAITDIHAKYKKLAIDADVAIGAITALGVPHTAATAIVHAWAQAVGAVEPS